MSVTVRGCSRSTPPFYGSAANVRLEAPVFAVVSTPTGGGYRLTGGDGGVFDYGDAGFYGSAAP
jgi:hypothetical protein